MGAFTTEEQRAIAEAREKFPYMPQRRLANKLYAEYHSGQIGYRLNLRSRQSIYGALRRHDARQQAHPVAAAREG